MHGVCCSVRGQRPEGALGWLSDCSSSTDLSSLCSATASLLLLSWPRRSDACTLQVNKECHWQREGERRGHWDRDEKYVGGNQEDVRKEGGKEAQEGDQRESWGRGCRERDRRWHWQTKCYNPAAPKPFLRELKAGFTAGQRQELVTGERLFFSRHMQRKARDRAEESQ